MLGDQISSPSATLPPCPPRLPSYSHQEKMIRHLLSHLQQSDILKIQDKVVSTALMVAAAAVRSMGPVFIVGDETLAGPALTGAKLQRTDTGQDTRGHAQTHPRTSSSRGGEGMGTQPT